MKRKFFIFSLPRSGSCWLSNFLSMPGSYCYHEPLIADMTWPLLLQHMDDRPELAVGAVDTDFHNRPFLPVEGAEYYVLRRDHNSVFRSQLIAYMTTWDADFKQQLARLDAHVERAQAKIIEHRKLQDLGYLREIWDMITGTPFDEERAAYLIEMNIQRIPAAIVQRQLAVKSGLRL